MNITPSLEKLKELAADGRYTVAPLSCELLADFTTPIGALRVLQAVSDHCFLLESARADETWGRYTFLGFEPKRSISCVNGELTDGDTVIHTDDPSGYLRSVLADFRSPRFPELPPFAGGLMGYWSYDYLGYSEPVVRNLTEDTEGFRDVDVMLFDKVIAFDHVKQKIVLIACADLSDVETGYANAAAELKRMANLLRHGEKKTEPAGRLTGEITELFNREEYCRMVEKAKDYIREGDMFQIVLSNRLSAPFEGSLLNTYRVLRTINPSPYMFYLSGTDVEVAGASPETLVKLTDGVLHTFPLAGTRPRGKTMAEDAELESELLRDEKELAEHNMLVDLGRNDLGKISKFGTVRVEKYHQIERFSHVMHIGSTVSGAVSARTATPLTPSRLFFRQEPFRERRRSGPASESQSLRTTSAASTAGLSATSISPATWTPASPSASPIRRTAKYSSGAARESWQTPCRRRNTRSAATRPWHRFGRCSRHRRWTNDTFD